MATKKKAVTPEMETWFFCWDGLIGELEHILTDDEEEAKEYDFYLKITVPSASGKVGTCVGEVVAL